MGQELFSEFSNPPPLSSFMLLPMLMPGRSPKVLSMQVSIGVNSFPPPTEKKTPYISVIFKKRFALLVRGFNICWGEQETLLMLDIRSVFHIFTNILLHFTYTCITEFFFFLAEPRHYILCVSLKFLRCKVFSFICILWHSMTMQ